jgi:hypothetical protein
MWFCCNLAQALLELGRDDEAHQWLERGRETVPSEERLPQMLWRQARGKVSRDVVSTRRGSGSSARRSRLRQRRTS